jgi:uncharacterized secreted repeat protein (TIGR03808 family)
MLNRRSVLFAPLALTYLRSTAFAETFLPVGDNQTEAFINALNAAYDTTGFVQLGAGTFVMNPLSIMKSIVVEGIPGLTIIRSAGDGRLFGGLSAKRLTLRGLSFVTDSQKGSLVTAEGVEQLTIEACEFSGGDAGLRIASCGGQVSDSRFTTHTDVGCHLIETTNFRVTNNRISDVGNNGIQVSRYQRSDDGAIISGNYIQRVAAAGGADGQFGNGVGVFLANGVTVTGNKISDCALTGVRVRGGSGSVISENTVMRSGEIAVHVEGAFEGAVIGDNIIDTAAHGIAIDGSAEGGRIAQCSGNLLRNIKGVDVTGLVLGTGISTEADTIIANNVVEAAADRGIALGEGKAARNLTATGNMIKDCPKGIVFSTVGEGPYLVSQNMITGAKDGAVLGSDGTKIVTADLSKPKSKLPAYLVLANNAVRN